MINKAKWQRSQPAGTGDPLGGSTGLLHFSLLTFKGQLFTIFLEWPRIPYFQDGCDPMEEEP